jgi:aerotaxis receptor
MGVKPMRRPEPVQQEISFALEDMFFSTTDSRGVILDGNDVFVRISQYSRDELIGAPHNIIRHPDMPKIVFKALWATIQAGKPICAYVKNLAKNGAYYWVFATVIPIGENYISIRMKPTTPLLGIVEKLYQELLVIEKEQGVEASYAALLSNLKALNFSDYSDFVLAALSQELLSRNELQNKKTVSGHNSSVIAISSRDLRNSSDSLFKLFLMVNKLSTYSEVLSKKAELIEETSQNIEFSALNTNIEAEKLGTDGRCLGVVAQHISSNSEAVKDLNNSIAKLSLKVLGNLSEFKACQLAIALSTLQAEMLSCFLGQLGDETSTMPV